MFGGTRRVPDFDGVVTSVCGESNAFTNNDYTNYYLTVPARHIDVALQLEADRMKGLDLSRHALEVQQHVVTEEYNQRYSNQPYGDMWLLMRPLCYSRHPYRWPTIGADISHVSKATLGNVEEFFHRFYRPDNAIVAVAGNIDIDETMRLVERLFGGTVGGSEPCRCRHLDPEPEPCEAQCLTVRRAVPNDSFYTAYLMCDRHSDDYYAFDLISDILSNGDSSRLYDTLVRRQALFSSIDAAITGDIDRGLFFVSGKLCEGVPMDEAERAVRDQLARMADEQVDSYELEKVVNKFESTFLFSQYRVSDRAHNLCYYSFIGDTDRINSEPSRYRDVTPGRLRLAASQCFRPERARTLYYMRED